MTVLFDHQIFSYQTFGGASRYYAELMTELYRAGEPFELGVASSPNEYLRTAPFYRGSIIKRAGVPGFARTYLRNELATRAAALRRQHDIVHATFYDPAARLGIGRAKLVVTVLDMIPEHFPEFFAGDGMYNRLVTRRWIAGKRTLCERADLIFAISEQTKQDVVRFYAIDPDRIVVTHLGNRLTVDNAPRPDGFPERYVLFVGTRNTYKNWDGFVAGVAPILRRDATLGIVCVGGGAFTDDESALLVEHGVSDRFVQRNVADHELAACYTHARAFVFPSLYEGFGIPILEAFACRCPALLADASCFPEIAGDAALLFDPRDPAALTTALERVLGDQALRARLIERGVVRARGFTWAETARQTLAAYRAVTRA